MALAMHSTATVSCEASEEQSGPTLVHSTGVKDYRVAPELIRVLQESCTNDNLCDHEKGVQCTHPAAHIVDVLKKAGFTVTTATTAGSRKMWMMTKTGEAGASQPSQPAHHDEHKPSAHDKGEAEHEEEEKEEEEEEEEEEK